MSKAENQKLDVQYPVERFQRGKINLRGQDPRKAFFMAISVGNLDGSISEMSNEGCEAITDTEAEAVEAAKQTNDSHPTMDVWIYRVVPVARVWRGSARVTKFTK